MYVICLYHKTSYIWPTKPWGICEAFNSVTTRRLWLKSDSHTAIWEMRNFVGKYEKIYTYPKRTLHSVNRWHFKSCIYNRLLLKTTYKCDLNVNRTKFSVSLLNVSLYVDEVILTIRGLVNSSPRYHGNIRIRPNQQDISLYLSLLLLCVWCAGKSCGTKSWEEKHGTFFFFSESSH